MRALVISHNFPPLNQISSYRPYSWTRALVEAGFGVTVLTSKKKPSYGDLSLAYDSGGFETIEVAIPDPYVRLVSRIAWMLRCAAVLLRMSRRTRFDVVISTHGPSPSHVLGYWASRVFPGSFWVADYRDLWTNSRYGRSGRMGAQNVRNRIEHFVVKHADLITTVSKGLGRILSAWFPGTPIRVIYNGYDRPLRPPATSINDGQTTLTLCHTGTIYPGKRDPSPLFRALSAMPEAERERIRICFAGTNLAAVAQSARDLGVDARVAILGSLTRDEAYSLQDESDMLLLIEDGEAAREGVLTGKFFEYLACGRPILAVGPDDSSEVASVLRETGTGVCVGTDVDHLTKVLIGALRRRPSIPYSPNPEAIARYSRERQAREFLAILDSLLARRGRVARTESLVRRAVCVLDKEYPPEESIVDGLFCALARRRGVRMYLVVSRGAERAWVQRYRGSICLSVLPRRRGLGRFTGAVRSFALMLALRRRWGDSRAIPIFVRNDPAYLAACLAARRLVGYRKVIYQNDFPFERFFRRSMKGRVGVWLLRRILRFVDDVIVVSDGGRERIEKLSRVKRVTVIPLCVDKDFLLDRTDGLAGDLRVLYLGTHREERSLTTIFEAAEDALRRGTRFTITSIGGTKEEIERLKCSGPVRRLLDSGALTLRPRIARGRIPSLLREHDVGLCLIPPTEIFTEASPTKLAEYMGAGLFVLASRGIPFQERVVQESGAGLLVDFERASIAQALERVSAQRDEILRRGRMGRDYVARTLNYANYEDTFARMLW
jgi:glycosyltransferase involved in cell wall biosynthesis